MGLVEGELARVGRGWCLVAGPVADWVVPLDALGAVRGTSPRAVPEVAWSPVTRLGLGSALRRLSEERERCVVHRRDGSRHEGTLERVGEDFVEVQETFEPVGHSQDGRLALVAYAALAAVQSRS